MALGVALCLVVGIVFFGVAFFLVRQARQKKLRCSRQTLATITAYVEKRDRINDGPIKTFYFPVYQYSIGGIWFEIKSNCGYSPKPYEEGSQILLFYNPNNPEDFCIEKDFSIKFLVVMFAFFGIFSVAMAVLLVIFSFM